MKEVKVLNAEETKALNEALEAYCQLLLPQEKERMGQVSFHLYHYENPDARNEGDWLFQIRWGTHKIFDQKHIEFTTESPATKQLQPILKKHCKAIHKALCDYCQIQLNNWALITLDPHIQRHNPDLKQYEIKVNHRRKKNNKTVNCGWPDFCIVLNWYDELGDFQEYFYPIKLNPENRRFELPAEHIALQFQKFRDTII